MKYHVSEFATPQSPAAYRGDFATLAAAILFAREEIFGELNPLINIEWTCQTSPLAFDLDFFRAQPRKGGKIVIIESDDRHNGGNNKIKE